jgi:hypothetical protein
MICRAKFLCNSVNQVGVEAIVYSFVPVCADEIPENQRFHKYTPGGRLEMQVNNPEVKFEYGKSYYLDFSEAPDV